MHSNKAIDQTHWVIMAWFHCFQASCVLLYYDREMNISFGLNIHILCNQKTGSNPPDRMYVSITILWQSDNILLIYFHLSVVVRVLVAVGAETGINFLPIGNLIEQGSEGIYQFECHFYLGILVALNTFITNETMNRQVLTALKSTLCYECPYSRRKHKYTVYPYFESVERC